MTAMRIVSLSLVLTSVAWAAPIVEVTGEVGPEFDSNPRRVASDESAQSDGLVRISAEGLLRWRPWERQWLHAAYATGGKVFFAEHAANEWVQRLSGSWGRSFDVARVGHGFTSLQAAYYDAFQQVSERDFRQGGGGVQLGLFDQGSGVLGVLHGEYHALQYKPDGNFSFDGPRAGLSLKRGFGRNPARTSALWEVGLAYTFAWRRYHGLALAPPAPCTGAPLPTDDDLCQRVLSVSRADDDHTLRAQLDYHGRVLASLWYALNINQSNSYGENYLRHIVGLRFTAPLVWDIYFTAKGVIQLSRFADMLFGQLPDQTLIDIDDENRSSIIVHLARDLGEHLALALRYSLYLNESSSTAAGQRVPGFIRHTLFFGLAFRYDTR